MTSGLLPHAWPSRGLPEGKTLSSLDEALLPPKVRRQLSALIEGSFVERLVIYREDHNQTRDRNSAANHSILRRMSWSPRFLSSVATASQKSGRLRFQRSTGPALLPSRLMASAR